MEESISMWSIILPVISTAVTAVITGITAYCIYQQNKHYLEIKLACEMIYESKKIVRQFIPSVKSDTNYISDAVEALNKFTSLGVDLIYIYGQLEQMGFDDCVKEMNDYVKRTEMHSYKEYDPEKNNFLEQALSALRKLQPQLIRAYKLEANTQIKNRKIGELENELYNVSTDILAYLSHVKLLIIQEKVPFIKAINQFLTTVSNKIKGYKNKLLLFIVGIKNKFLDWQIQSKK